MQANLEQGNDLDPYCVGFQNTQGITIGHIPREISRGAHYFIIEGGKITAKVCCTKRKPSPIEQGGLEIDLLISATHQNRAILVAMQEFVLERNTHYAEKPFNTEQSSSKISVTKKNVTLASPDYDSEQDSDADVQPASSKKPRVIVIDSD